MSLQVHHINCGTLCPMCQRLIQGFGSWLKPAKMVCHCLLVESPKGLVLVDTGFGTQDILDSKRRLGAGFLQVVRPALNMEETALQHIQQRGFAATDVSHIIPTHLDLDHAGGLSDFPHAQVHVLDKELRQLHRPWMKDRLRFRAEHFAHSPNWVTHSYPTETWFGLDVIRPIADLDILMLPLIGHTRGHVGVAVKAKDGWLLHCGDAYFHHSQITDHPEDMPAGLVAFEKAVETLPRQRKESLAVLQRLHREHSEEITFFCAHDVTEFERFQA